MRENEEYYQLRPYVRCQTASGEFDVSIHNGGPLDIYYDEKLDEEAANDLAFYLEKKLPYITGVQALQISIYRFTIKKIRSINLIIKLSFYCKSCAHP